MKVNDVKKALKKKKRRERLSFKDFLSTGSTLLNLACTGKPYCGFAKGRYYFIVGDSISGKTFLSLTCLAEASLNPNFDDYRFIYDNSEGGALMDIKRFFGKRVFKRMEPPSWDKGPLYSSTIEEFYYNVDDAISLAIESKGQRPFIYILDSMDSLSSESEADKFDKQKTAHRKGKETAGSYTDGKAKWNSQKLRRLLTPLRNTGSILIVISQTRDSLGFGFEKKTRSGGRALRFYACLEMWSSVKKKITKTIAGKKRQLGVECLIQIKKNRIIGKEPTRDEAIIIPIYHSFGIDDIGSCVNYLVEEKHWGQKDNIIRAPEFRFKGPKGKLISHIEANEMEKDLRDIVAEVWNEIEVACEVKRKRRY